MHRLFTKNISFLVSRDALCSALMFLFALVIFLESSIGGIGDSKYTLLVTQNLLSKGTFAIDGYSIPHDPAEGTGGGINSERNAYQAEFVNGHLYYYFPPGTSILSAPFVLIGNYLGFSVVRKNGTYSPAREESIQGVIASLLMAFLSVIFYLTARLILPYSWSIIIASSGVFSTQVWSTASRSLWAHTWGISLLGFALYLLLAAKRIGTGSTQFC